MRSNTRAIRDWVRGWIRRRLSHRSNVFARHTVGTFERIFPACSAVARETGESFFLGTRGTAVAVVVQTARITVNFVLAVGPDLGISRKTFAHSIGTLHVGALTVGVNQTRSRLRWISGGNLNIRFLAGRDSVSNKTFLAGALKAANRVSTFGSWVTGRLLLLTFDLIDALNWTVVKRNVRLVGEFVRKKWSKAILADTAKFKGWKHIDADRSSRTGGFGLAFVLWSTQYSTVPIHTRTCTVPIRVNLTRGSFTDTVCITTLGPSVEGSRA